MLLHALENVYSRIWTEIHYNLQLLVHKANIKYNLVI